MTTTESPVLAKLGPCCITGYKHTGDPTGTVIQLGGMDTYLAEPPAGTQGPKKVLLFISDVHGSMYLNAKLLQDNFATQGFTVVGPDFFGEDNVVYQMEQNPTWAMPEIVAWASGKLEGARTKIVPWLAAVREKFGVEGINYFAAGYCFGAPFVFDLARTDSIEAGVVTHPTFLEEDHFKNMQKSILVTCAEIDLAFALEARRRAEDILIEGKKEYHFQVFSGVTHGFTTRGDLSNKNIVWAREEAVRGATHWFNKWVKL